jgi:DNA invertase Pin-like site-specific DNA recombinase
MPRTTSPATVTRTVAYLRVSTDKQADRGVSLDAQRAKVEAYASLYDLDLVEVIVEQDLWLQASNFQSLPQ